MKTTAHNNQGNPRTIETEPDTHAMSRTDDNLNKARILVVYRQEIQLAVDARNKFDLALAFHHYERAHILSQRFTWPHIKSHLGMLRIGYLRKDMREMGGAMCSRCGGTDFQQDLGADRQYRGCKCECLEGDANAGRLEEFA